MTKRFEPAFPVTASDPLRDRQTPPSAIGESLFENHRFHHPSTRAHQGQRQLTLCASEGFDEEIEVPGTTATFHDEAAFAGMLLEER